MLESFYFKNKLQNIFDNLNDFASSAIEMYLCYDNVHYVIVCKLYYHTVATLI